MKALSETLAAIGFFQALAPEELERVAALGAVRSYPPSTVLFHEGEEGDCLYVVLEGRVEVYREDSRGERTVVARFARGDYFGELALIDGARRSATVVTEIPCTLFLMGRDQFLGFISRSPPLLSRLLAELSGRIRETTKRLHQEAVERRLRVAEDEVARQRAIAMMVTGVAHELNTPLGVCTTSASVIEDAIAADRHNPNSALAGLHEPVELLTSNLQRVVSLVQLFTNIAATHHADRVVSVDLAEVVADAALLHRERVGSRRLAVGVAKPADPLIWRGHRSLLQRVLQEVLANVEAHGFPAGSLPRAEVHLDRSRLNGRPAFAITVRDQGVGIAPHHRPHLFDAFFTTARGRGHKGLGLAIVYNAVTGPLRGQISIESEPGAGTTVLITVPSDLGPDRL